MPIDDLEFQKLWAQVKAGSPEATGRFCELYGPMILRAVRKRLGSVSRQVADSQDFTQDVWSSFFRQLPGGIEFESMSAIVKYLLQMADHKVIDEIRRISTKKRIPGRDVSSFSSIKGTKTGSQIMMAIERRQKMTENVPEQYRPLIQLLSEGWTNQEIADHIGVSVRTVRRIVQSLRAVVKQ